MKINHLLLFFAACLFVSCSSDDQQYEYVNVAKPITISVAELRSSVEVLPAQNIIQSGKIYAYEQYVFINDVDKGVHVVDNRNPLQPTIINFLKIPFNKDISIKDDYLYADSGMDLVVFNIADINNIQMIGRAEDVLPRNYVSYPVDAIFFDLEDYNAQNDIIIGWEVALERREVIEYDYETIATNNFGGDVGTGGSLARFKIVNDYLYAVDNSKINVFDIQNLTSPVKVNEEFVTWEAETIFYEDNKLFIGTRTGMYIYDISQPSSPTYLSDFDHLKFCDPVIVDGDYAYVTLRAGASCMDGESQMLESRLEIINISDIYNPILEETYFMDEPYGLGIKDDRLFICDGASGLKVYNKTDVSNLQLLQNYSGINAYDVIPLGDKLLMIGDNKLTQYIYTETGIELLSEFNIQ